MNLSDTNELLQIFTQTQIHRYFPKDQIPALERCLDLVHHKIISNTNFYPKIHPNKVQRHSKNNNHEKSSYAKSFGLFDSLLEGNNSENHQSHNNSFLFEKDPNQPPIINTLQSSQNNLDSQNQKGIRDNQKRDMLIAKRAASFRIFDEEAAKGGLNGNLNTNLKREKSIHDTSKENLSELFQSNSNLVDQDPARRRYKRNKSFLDSKRIKINFCETKSALEKLNERIASILPKARAKEYKYSILVNIAGKSLLTLKDKSGILEYAIINTFIVFLIDAIMGSNREKLDNFLRHIRNKKFKC